MIYNDKLGIRRINGVNTEAIYIDFKNGLRGISTLDVANELEYLLNKEHPEKRNIFSCLIAMDVINGKINTHEDFWKSIKEYSIKIPNEDLFRCIAKLQNQVTIRTSKVNKMLSCAKEYIYNNIEKNKEN